MDTNIVDDSLEKIRLTSCETEAFAQVATYIHWLESIFRFCYQDYYKGYSSEDLRKEYHEGHHE